MKFTPLRNNVLIRRKKSEEKTPGGLIIPMNASEKSQEGEVLATGYGTISDAGELIPISVKPGDVILFENRRGAEITLDGEKYLILKEDDIIGVFNS